MDAVILKDTALEIGIDNECPICGENPHYNAKALAAIEEGRAIIRGEIPAIRHKPILYQYEKISNNATNRYLLHTNHCFTIKKAGSMTR